MTAANEMERVRLRAHQVLAFSEVMHERLGSSCTIDAVGDVQPHVEGCATAGSRRHALAER